MRHRLAVALGSVIFAAGLASPVPARTPAPSPTPSPAPSFAPIEESASPDPAASTGPNQPKVLGHIYASAYCSNFVERYNTAARIVIDNDHRLDAVDANLHSVEDDWDRTDGAQRVYDDRVKMIATVAGMLKSIPVSQAAVNALLAQAKETTDPERRAALLASASQLQKTIDRQRAVTYDLTNVIHVLLDKHKQEDTAEENIRNTLPPGYQSVNIDANDAPVPEPGTNTMMVKASPSPGASPAVTHVEDIMQWDRQRSIIGTAETGAAKAADRVVRICNSERPPTAPPAAIPSPSPHP